MFDLKFDDGELLRLMVLKFCVSGSCCYLVKMGNIIEIVLFLGNILYMLLKYYFFGN